MSGEASNGGGGDGGAMVQAGSMAAQWLYNMFDTVVGGGGTAWNSNIYFIPRVERAERRNAQLRNTVIVAFALVLLALLIIWIAKKPTKN